MIQHIVHLAIEIEQMLGLPAALAVGWYLRARREHRTDARDDRPVGRGIPIPLSEYAAAANVSLEQVTRSAT